MSDLTIMDAADGSYLLDGVAVAANKEGNVFWMSDWSRCDELARAGLLRKVCGGPGTFGHVDFYIA